MLGRRGIRELNRLVNGSGPEGGLNSSSRVAPRYEGYLFATPAVDRVNDKLSSRQSALLDAVRQPPGRVSLADANREFGPGVANALWKKGLVAQEWWRTSGGLACRRSGREDGNARPAHPHRRSARGASEITSALDASFKAGPGSSSAPPSRPDFLLHGVTGSGKTEVYLRAIAQPSAWGSAPSCWCPRSRSHHRRWSASTPGRGTGRPDTQRTDGEAEVPTSGGDIRGGAFDVVVGPAKRLFAPLENLGLIVIDEEHE